MKYISESMNLDNIACIPSLFQFKSGLLSQYGALTEIDHITNQLNDKFSATHAEFRHFLDAVGIVRICMNDINLSNSRMRRFLENTKSNKKLQTIFGDHGLCLEDAEIISFDVKLWYPFVPSEFSSIHPGGSFIGTDDNPIYQPSECSYSNHDLTVSSSSYSSPCLKLDQADVKSLTSYVNHCNDKISSLSQTINQLESEIAIRKELETKCELKLSNMQLLDQNSANNVVLILENRLEDASLDLVINGTHPLYINDLLN